MGFNNMPEIRQDHLESRMRFVAASIEKLFPGLGFCLIIFPFFKKGVGNYISNAERVDMVAELRATADRLENMEDIPAILPGEH